MKPTLLVLAAGMGSRYGSLKQMDGIGPNNEAIIDYSVYDAIRAGFGKVVFVIRHYFADDFISVFNSARFCNRIEVQVVYQELEYLPIGYTVPLNRVKPWGTNHAVLMAANTINEPFAVINADDFYGFDAFKVLCDYLSSLNGQAGKYAMVAYYLKNTLSDFGSVSRGVCSQDELHNLIGMVERTSIERTPNRSIAYNDTEGEHILDENTMVSMNFFGFTPDYFLYSTDEFKMFLDNEANQTNLKSEFFIPLVVNKIINSGKAEMRVLSSDAQWFGVTYKEDKPNVVAKINALIAKGIYPSNLWNK